MDRPLSEPPAPKPLLTLTGQAHATVPGVFAPRVKQSPDRIFIRYKACTWTFADAWQEATRFAGRYAAAGLTSGDRVASLLPSRPEAIWAWLGTQLLGAVHVWINPQHRGELLAEQLRRSRAAVLVTDAAAREVLPASAITGIPRMLCVDQANGQFTALGYQELPAADAIPLVPAAAGFGAAAIVLFTSGTTGRSKAVLVPHNMICRGSARMCEYAGITESDVIQAWLPMHHIGGVDAVTMALLSGCTLDLLPGFSASRFWADVARSQASVFFLFPAIAHILLGQRPDPGDTTTSLRVGIETGLSPGTIKEFEDRYQVRLLSDYGMTEAQPIAYTALAKKCPPGSSGRPNPDFTVAILSHEDTPLPPSHAGQIAIRPNTPGIMMLGYEDDALATVKSWRNLWYHTGDLGRLDHDGFLYFVDRQADAIRRRGENISSWEVEAVLTDHSAVETAAVVAVPSPLGEDDVKAVVVLSKRGACHPKELHAHCAARMARFMIPRYIEIRDELPLTQTGKVRKESLRSITGQEWDANNDQDTVRGKSPSA
jgi:crotonobetaine/carnitine-CoA ligase